MQELGLELITHRQVVILHQYCSILYILYSNLTLNKVFQHLIYYVLIPALIHDSTSQE